MHFLKGLFLTLITLCSYFMVSGQPAIKFNRDLSGSYIGKYMSLFVDTSRTTLPFEAVAANPSLFRLQTDEVPNLGVSEHVNWLKFKVQYSSRVYISIENPSIDEVTLYVTIGDTLVKKETAVNNNFKDRRLNHQFYIFELPTPSDLTVTCYLKLVGNTQLLAPVTLSTGDLLFKTVSDSETLSGIYMGIMIAMILYNIFIYFSTRDISYLYYINYIFWVAMAQVTLLGYSSRFIWGTSHWLTEKGMLLTAAFAGIATILFVKKFLNTRQYARPFNTLLSLVLIAECIAIAIFLCGFDVISYNIINSIAGIGAIVIFITAIAVLSRKRKPAIFFIMAWSIFLTSVVVFVLKDFGFLKYNFITIHAMQIGSAIEAVLLSFALADSINVLKKEKDQSRLAALRIAKENSRIIKEQNIVLETKVKERTEELVQKNDELNQTLHNLQQAQMKLVESEKMASLGQLTAGIAHEINNPINFVTGNIGPLKRDVDVLFATINLLEENQAKEIPLEQKQKELAQFKEEQDFDYLKKEIAYLLKGINEGAGRTAEIVKSLRVFSRLDEDVLKLADINEGLESTLVIVNNLIGNIQVIKKYGNIPLLNCYPGKLNQVFLNIISNGLYAIKERFNDGVGGQFIVETAHDDQFLYIRFIDNGVGMKQETKQKIFDPFFTTKDVGQGTGLGMSIAFQTIQKHNGEIKVTSEVGEGANFEIKIPMNIV